MKEEEALIRKKVDKQNLNATFRMLLFVNPVIQTCSD